MTAPPRILRGVLFALPFAAVWWLCVWLVVKGCVGCFGFSYR
jgi:hypothetical protein